MPSELFLQSLRKRSKMCQLWGHRSTRLPDDTSWRQTLWLNDRRCFLVIYQRCQIATISIYSGPDYEAIQGVMDQFANGTRVCHCHPACLGTYFRNRRFSKSLHCKGGGGVCELQLYTICHQIHQPARIDDWGGFSSQFWQCQDFESACSWNTSLRRDFPSHNFFRCLAKWEVSGKLEHVLSQLFFLRLPF